MDFEADNGVKACESAEPYGLLLCSRPSLDQLAKLFAALAQLLLGAAVSECVQPAPHEAADQNSMRSSLAASLHAYCVR